MMRVGSWCTIGFLVGVGVASPAYAQLAALAPLALAPLPPSDSDAAATSSAELRGIVKDERGSPLAGAVVSALGATSAFAVSDSKGRFVFRALSPGPYLVRAHLQDYLQPRGRVVQVIPDSRTTSTIELIRRPDAGEPPVVLAASVGAGAPPAAEVEAEEEQDEVAWRLRHAKRSILKEAKASIADLDDDGSVLGDSLSIFGRAVGGSTRLASSLFADLSVNGQLNLLTSTSFDRPQDLFSHGADVPHGVAYVALEAPGSSGDWTMRGTLTQGDLASWILAGSYVRHRPVAHAYEAGVSYGMQRYLGGNDALAASRDGSRNVGSMYAVDNWTVTPQIHLSYGAEYARYDYLADRALFSPRATIVVQPSSRDSLKLRTTVSRRETAPGAEEFRPSSAGLWLPPERTFSQISHAPFLPERHDLVELVVDREWSGLVVGVRAFRERVEDQVVTLFGMAVGDTPADVGHYRVASAGDFDARGWGVAVTHVITNHVRASIDYTQAQAVWRRRSPDMNALAELAGSVVRNDERIHDVTARVESVVEPTSTRLFVIYKLNSAFSGSGPDAVTPSAGVRFDVQVNQALPFLNFMNAQWEMLVAVSNLFRDELLAGSVYDELLVVRPPKRMLGGVTVRF